MTSLANRHCKEACQINPLLHWVTPEVLYRCTGISKRHQNTLREKKQIPYSKLGNKKTFYYLPTIDEWIERHRMSFKTRNRIIFPDACYCKCTNCQKRRIWISTKNLRNFLDLSMSFQVEYRKNGILPYRKPLSYIRYDANEIDKVLHQHTMVSLDDIFKK